jgi:hypothetical protein
MSTINWNKVFEFAWRILVFIVAVAIIVIVSTNWNRWDGALRVGNARPTLTSSQT